ncbi:hypothetical protein C922_05372 [Plasmodium inui San Antonio 1]|uniref:Uncharacterized protein n=1 Tax=Plasmodium inui San Antonio 1 TaxID=1237626 RepID=W7AG16_9APIC|nr:hypothetical protein C922_05372 [Plasmodium inui San Antonio 1]EUD64241.1 hypothetical protein C922_05372 [Plasmodium inui San Antonio 1]
MVEKESCNKKICLRGSLHDGHQDTIHFLMKMCYYYKSTDNYGVFVSNIDLKS